MTDARRDTDRAAQIHELVGRLRPPKDWPLPISWDGVDLLAADGRILVWDGEAGERTGRYIERLVNGIVELHRLAKLALLAQEPGVETVCQWITESDSWNSDLWITGCGQEFVMLEPGRPEEEFKFCCYCGKRLSPAPSQEQP